MPDTRHSTFDDKVTSMNTQSSTVRTDVSRGARRGLRRPDRTARAGGGAHGVRALTAHRTSWMRDLWVMLLVAFVATTTTIAGGVQTAQADGDSYDAHLVETVTPTNTTINLFDYWATNGANDNSQNITNTGAGINGGHTLKFNNGQGSDFNKWTGKEQGPCREIVQNTLGSDGYPVLSEGTESLSYLFDDTNYADGKQPGKVVYKNVGGLLQLDENGNYVYDSHKNYAAYDAVSNSFKVYDAAGVKSSSDSSATGYKTGQFFPFNAAETVFSVNGQGSLQANNVYDGNNDTLNHHFGLSMTSTFVQPNNGKTNGNDMVFEFSGDDDVWVYIDGVLVGDLGGIHDACGLKINFATGKVTITKGSGVLSGSGAQVDKETTLWDQYVAALGAEEAARYFTDDHTRFKDNTYHELKFFYLERGAGSSNMKLTTNLYTTTASDVTKYDQNNQPVVGAKFELYRADGSYTVVGDPIASGVTGADGVLTLTDKSGQFISFDQEATDKDSGTSYFVLREVSVPDGYRTGLYNTKDSHKELHLHYVKAGSANGGVLVSPDEEVDGLTINPINRQWLSGGYLASRERFVAPDTVAFDNGSGTANIRDGGTLFAVVFAKGDDGNWYPVTGTSSTGYELLESAGKAGAVAAANAASGVYVFTKDASTHQFTTEITSMPGNILDYAYMKSGDDKKDARYTVGLYYTTADSLDGATEDNTLLVNRDSFNSKFSTSVRITNVRNRLWAQKVDEAGNPVDGAQFALYRAEDVKVDGDGKVTGVKDGASPVDTGTTTSEHSLYDLPGSVCFPVESDKHENLTEGTYYLHEAKAPDGYSLNDAWVKVVVQSDGVYADAGEADDGVWTFSGPGSLAATLSEFGSNDAIDNTLTYIKGNKQTGTLAGDGTVTWNEAEVDGSDTVHMQYGTLGDNGSVLQYVVRDGAAGELPIMEFDTGWNRMALFQDETPDGTPTKGSDLGNLQVNQLFTTSVGVRIQDERVASLEVTKQVEDVDEAYDDASKQAAADAEFFFQLTLSDAQGAGLSADQTFGASIYKTVTTQGEDGATTTAEELVGDLTVKNGDIVSLRKDETLRVYGLPEGTQCTVSELNWDTRLTAVELEELSDASAAVVSEDGAAGANDAAAGTGTAEGANAANANGVASADTANAADASANGAKDGDAKDARPDASARVVTQDYADTHVTRGFHLTKRAYADGTPYPSGDNDNSMTCTVERGDTADGKVTTGHLCRLVFTNSYEPTAAKLGGDHQFRASKTFTSNESDRTWTDQDVFTLRLEGLAGKDGTGGTDYAPMPDGAVTSDKDAPYIEEQVSAATQSVVASDSADTRTILFDDIAYSKPGTYAYHITETLGTITGVMYSRAQYHVTVKVVNEMKEGVGADGVATTVPTGRLVVESVTYRLEMNGNGTAVPEDSDEATVSNNVAAFTNVYDNAEETFQPAATKVYKGDDVLEKGMFSFTLTAVGGKDVAKGADSKPNAWAFTSTDSLSGLDVAAADVPLPGTILEDADGQGAAPSQTVTNGGAAANNSAPVTFEAITYTAQNDLGADKLGRTYVYKLTENAGERKAVTYDNTTYYLVVTCTPQNAGIAVSAQYYRVDKDGKTVEALGNQDDGQPVLPTFTNTYNSTPANVRLKAYKNLEGRDWNRFDAHESYTFILKPVDDGTLTAVKNGTITGLEWDTAKQRATALATYASVEGLEPGQQYYTVGDDKKVKDSREAWFEQVPGSGITFSKKGTYTFSITEDASNPYAGVTYDAHVWTVTVKVTDADDNGVYEAHVSYSSDDGKTASAGNGTVEDTARAAFTNTYTARGSYAGVNIAKTLQGREAGQDEFTFDVTALTYDGTCLSNLSGTVKSGEAFTGTQEHLKAANGREPLAGTITQGSLGKTFLFRIQENVPEGAEQGVKDGTTYDTQAAYVLVEVKSLYDVTKNPADAAKLYAVTTVLRGADVDAAVQQAALDDDADWKDVFSAESIEKFAAGSKTVYSQLTSDKAIDATKQARVAFSNTYTSSLDYTAAGGVSIAKTLQGAGGTPSTSFTFRVTAIDADGAVSKAETAQKLFGGVDTLPIYINATSYGTFTQQVFNNLTFNQDDNGKTFAFNVQEVMPEGTTQNEDGTFTKDGMVYDQATYTVTIAVKDDGKGNLTTVTLVKDQDGAIVRYEYPGGEHTAQLAFTNTYDAQPVTWTPTVVKQIAGVASTTDTFTFKLTSASTETDAALANGTVTSGMKKVPLSDGSSQGADETGDDEGATPPADDPKDQWVETATTGGQEIKEGAGDSDGCTVSFGTVTFTQPGTYQFMVFEEMPADDEDWNYSEATYIYTVTVKDGGKGQLEAKYVIEEHSGNGFVHPVEGGVDLPVFLNTNGAVSAYSGVDIVKELTGKQLQQGMFTFTIEPMDTPGGTEKAADARAALGKDPMLELTNNVGPATCLNTVFSAEKDNGKVYTYKVYEVAGSGSGYTYDDSYYIVTVAPVSTEAGSMDVTTTVTKYTKGADGAYTAGDPVTTVDKDGSASEARPTLTFTNEFKARGELKGGTASIEASKTLTGRTMKAGEFKFNLALVYTDKDGVEQTIQLDKQGTNLEPDANGVAKVSFPSVAFTVGYGLPTGAADLEQAVKSGTLPLDLLYEAGMASYDEKSDTYTINLKVYEDKASLPEGVTAVPADAVEQVAINVQDNPNGTLTAHVTYRDGQSGLAFSNSYTPAKTVSATTGTGADRVTIKDADGRLVGVGDTLTYTVNWVNNAGAGSATPTPGIVTITDELPAGLDADSVETPQPSGVACSITKVENEKTGRVTVTWTLGTEDNPVPANASGSVTVRAKVSADAAKLVGADGMVVLGNTVTITLPDASSYTGTTTNYVPGKTSQVKDAPADQTSGTVRVGQDLTFTIAYKNTEKDAATVVVTDKVPAGTTFVAGSAGEGVEPDEDGTLTWTIPNVAAGDAGSVSFTVHVTEGALATGHVDNAATVQVGNNPKVSTTPTSDRVRTGALALSKTVKSDGTAQAPDAVFTFKVTLKESAQDGAAPLTGTYQLSGTVAGKPLNNESRSFDSNGCVQLLLKASDTLTIEGLPEGAYYTIEETSSFLDGFTPTYTNATGTIKASEVAGTTRAAVTNTYTAKPSDALAGFAVKKVLAGRAWQDNETFTFILTADASNPDPTALPEGGTELTIGKPEGADPNAASTTATGGFGGIVFKKAGNYTYTIREKQTSQDAYLTYSQAEYQVRVKVTNDVTSNKLQALVTGVTQVKNVAGVTTGVSVKLDDIHFTNTYASTGQDEKHVYGADGTQLDGKSVCVGDVLTYRISWANGAYDASGAATKANVTVTDTLPKGVEYVGGSANVKPTEQNGATLTWELGEKGIHESGTVEFRVRVTEAAFEGIDASTGSGTLANAANITLTNNGRTFTTPVEVSNTLSVGTLALSKALNLTQENADEVAAAKEEFSFVVKLGAPATDAGGNPVYQPLTEEYAYKVYQKDAGGDAYVAEGRVKSGDIIALKANQKAVIEGLPDGTAYRVMEQPVADYSPTVPANYEGTIDASAARGVEVAFVNTDRAMHQPEVRKVLTGDGAPELTGGMFSFTMKVAPEKGSPTDGFHMDNSDKDCHASNDKDGNVRFGEVFFDKAGRYRVTITEDQGSDPLITYDGHAYTYVIVVTESNGKLTADVDMDTIKGADMFTNTWTGQQKKTVDVVPAKGDTTLTDADGKLVGVGDTLTYRIQWVNSATDENGRATAVDKIVVTDTVPAGVALDEQWLKSAAAGLTQDGTGYKDAFGNHVEIAVSAGTITWAITGKDGGQVDAGAHGTLSFRGTVTEGAAQVSGGKIDNQATVKIGNDAPTTNWVSNPVAAKTLQTPTTGGLEVGDVVTYSVTAANGDADGGKVVVEDTLSKGLEFVDSSADGNITTRKNADGTTSLQWVFENTPKGWSQTVTYRVRVTEDALTVSGSTIPNQATITVGNHPSVTNTVTIPKPQTAPLTIVKIASSTVDSMGEDTEFTFRIEAWYTNEKGEKVPLMGTYHDDGYDAAYKGAPLEFKNGEATFKLTGTIGSGGMSSVTFVGLPKGAEFKITEDGASGWQQTTLGAQGTVGDGLSVRFENKFTPENAEFSFMAGKKLDGRDAQANETYTLELTPLDGTPMPEGVDGETGTSTLTLNMGGASKNSVVTGSFGTIAYDDLGTYSYLVTERCDAKDANLTYSQAQYRVDVTVGTERQKVDGSWTLDKTKLAVRQCTWTQVVDDAGNPVPEDKQTSVVVYQLGNAASGMDWNPDAQFDIDRRNDSDYLPVFTNTYKAPDPTKDVLDAGAATPTVSWNGKAVQVGDTLTYVIGWNNTAIDETGAAAAGSVRVSDTVPAGTVYVEGSAASDHEGTDIWVSEDGTTLTWAISNAAAGDAGFVSFKVRVTEEALGRTDKDGNPVVTNMDASVSINDNPGVTVQPGTSNPVERGALSITKELDNGSSGVSGTLIPKDRDFTFTVTLTDASGAPLTGTYPYTVTTIDRHGDDLKADGRAEGQAPQLALDGNGQGTLLIKGGQTVTVQGLPAGATYTVSETPAAGWTQSQPADAAGNPAGVMGTVMANETVGAVFTNEYTPEPASLNAVAKLGVAKTLAGRAWGDDETFAFTLTPQDNTAGLAKDAMPLPEGAQDGVATTALSKDATAAVFGDIEFERAGTYRYAVTEVGADKANLTYSQARHLVTITVGLDAANNRLTVTSCQMVMVIDDAGTSTYTPVSADVDGKTLTARFTNTYAEPAPVKTVTKADASGVQTDVDGKMVGVGDTLTYTVTWTNTAVASDGTAAPADTVTVTDTVPAGTVYIEGSAASDASHEANTAIQVSEDGTLTWTVSNVAAGDAGSVSFQVTVGQDAATFDELANTASVQVGGHDPRQSNTVTNTVPTKRANGELAVSDGVQVGDVLTYTVDYRNDGTDAAQVVVTDQLPAGLAYVDGTAAIDGRGPAAGEFEVSSVEGGASTLTWTIPNVAPGASGQVSFQARVTEAAVVSGAADNTARVQVADNPSVSTNTVPGPQLRTGALAISKTVVAPDYAQAPQNATFTFNVTLKDNGGNPLAGTYTYKVTNADGEPALGEDGVQLGGTVGDGGTIGLASGQTATVENLPVGTAYTVTETPAEDFQQTAPVDDAGKPAAASGTVAAAAEVDGQDAAAPARADFTNAYVKPAKAVFNEDGADADAASDADAAAVQVGDILTYAINFENADGEGATATVVDALGRGLVYYTDESGSGCVVTVEAPDGSVDTYGLEPTVGVGDDGAQTLTWSIPDLPAGAQVALAFRAQVTRDAYAAVDNTATVNGHESNTTTTNVGTDDAKHVFAYNEAGTGAQIDSQLVHVGDKLTYRIDWANPADNKGGTVTVTDVLPEGLELDEDAVDDIKADGGSYDAATRTIVWALFDVPGGMRGTVSFDATVTAAALQGIVSDNGQTTLTNTATVKAGTSSVDVRVDNYVDAGQLVIEKSVSGMLADGTTPANATFTFNVTIAGADGAAAPALGELPCQVVDIDSGNVVETRTLAFAATDDGAAHATLTLRGGQRAIVGGLPVGSACTVAEDTSALPQGWAVAEGSGAEVSVTAAAGATDENTARFANAYAAPLPEKDVDLTPASQLDVTITDADGKLVGVGDKLMYRIGWTNLATDDQGNDIASDVVITDQVPAGTTLVKDSPASDAAGTEVSVSDDGRTITWTVRGAEARAAGTVSFQVTVDEPEDAEVTYDKVENTAHVSATIGGHTATVDTNTAVNPRPEKELVPGGDDADGVQVGDMLTYRVTFANNAGAGAAATVTDVLPVGLMYVDGTAQLNGEPVAEGQFDAGAYDPAGAQRQTLTWTFAAQEGTNAVSFQARVTEAALTARPDNTAGVQLGDDPSVSTNTVPGPQPETGSLTVTKDVKVTEGAGGAAFGAYDESFAFTLALRDAKGAPLTGTYAYTLTAADGTTSDGTLTFVYDATSSTNYGATTFALKGGESITVQGLPVGASYQVTENLTEEQEAAGWEADESVVFDKTVTGDPEKDVAAFTNTLYGTGSTASVTVDAAKVLLGRAQVQEEFKFDVTTRGAQAGDETVLHGFAGAAADGVAAPVTLTSDGVLTFDRASLAQAVAMGYATVDASKDGIAMQWTVSYTIAERTGEGDLPAGVTPTAGTPTSYDFAVRVADDGHGQLEAHILDADGQPVAEGFAFVFSNTYAAGGQLGTEGETSIAATKTLQGRAAQAGEFSFEATDAAGNLVASATNAASDEGAAGALTFSPIRYTLEQGAEGAVVSDGFSSQALADDGTGVRKATFAYTVSELVGNLPGGVAAVEGKTSYDVSVTVTDNGDGTLGATVVYPEGTPETGLDFQNSYLSDGWATATLSGTKVVEGLPEGSYLASGDYSFELAPVSDDGASADPHNPAQTTTVVADGAQGASGTFSFGLHYNTEDLSGVPAADDGSRSRTFHYLLSEVVPSTGAAFGVAYDTMRYDVYVTLTDDGAGKLGAAVSGIANHADGSAVDAPSFTNVYDADEVMWAPTAWKATAAPTGADLSGATFSYLVTTPDAAGGLVRVGGGTSGANGAVAFDRFKVPGEGTFTYYLSELTSGAAAADAGAVDEATGAVKGGITYDGTFYLMRLTVTRAGNGTYDFEAHYYLNGDEGQEVYPGDGSQPGGVVFNNTYVSVGTSVQLYARKIVDGPHALDGFQFRVTDDATGAEVANGVSDADGNVTFSKIYYADAVPTAAADAADGAGAAGTVLEDGSVVNADGSVTHPDGSITYADGSMRRADGALVAPDGTVTMPDGTVVAPDAGDSENGGGAAGEEPGAGDAAGEEPGGDATGEEPGAGDATGEEPGFGDAGAEPGVEAGAEAEADAEGGAEAEAAGGADSPEAASLLDALDLAPSIAVADDAGAQEFSTEAVPAAATYTAGVVEEHWYTISEVDTGLAGVTYDTTSWKVHVTVSDDGSGQLSAVVDSIVEVSVGADGQVYQTERGTDQSVIVFENSYKACNPATVQLAGTKVLNGHAAQAGAFTFSVVDQATGEVVAGGRTSADAEAGAVAPISFGSITYTEAGEHDYLVSEDRGGTTVAGVTYDAAVYAVHVSVADMGDGNLSAQVTRVMAADGTDVTDAGANGLRFTNTYAASGEASATLAATKTLTGRDAKAGEFGFEVRDASGALVTVGSSAAAKDGEAATVTFGQLHFSAAGDYAYTVREVHAGGHVAGVTYDDASFVATVHVADMGDGTLGVTGVDYAAADGGAVAGMAFANTYKADKPLSVTPNAGKKLTGRALTAGEFSFEVRDADGTVVSSGMNDAAGNVKFDAITLDAAGVYEYTLAEKVGSEAGVTYDAATYRMTVTVTDKGDGTLCAKVAYADASGNTLAGADRPTFVNAYTSSEPGPNPNPEPTPTPTPGDGGNGGGTTTPGGSSPKTGDATADVAVLAGVGVAGATALAGGAALLLRRRREE